MDAIMFRVTYSLMYSRKTAIYLDNKIRPISSYNTVN